MIKFIIQLIKAKRYCHKHHEEHGACCRGCKYFKGYETMSRPYDLLTEYRAHCSLRRGLETYFHETMPSNINFVEIMKGE